jgi:hypothetical protein
MIFAGFTRHTAALLSRTKEYAVCGGHTIPEGITEIKRCMMVMVKWVGCY